MEQRTLLSTTSEAIRAGYIQIFITALKISIDILRLHSVTLTVLFLLTGFKGKKGNDKKKKPQKSKRCLFKS
jgi:hypothetical protein